MMLTAARIRQSFIDFFRDKGHELIPSSPVVAADDETLLFTNAGMNQFKDVFIGRAKAPCARAVNSQKCLRVSGKHNDLEEVGTDFYHHTFFEMLGNWSFDDYFKAEAIEWAWELLTGVWGIDPRRLWATVFAGDKKLGLPPDEQARRLWTAATPLPAERVLAFGSRDNFWEMGATGPCGPCSEVHIDLGPGACLEKGSPSHKCRVNGGCGRFIELWNLVFIQHDRTSKDGLVSLPARYVDTGAGLERLAAVLQEKTSDYDTDLFTPVIAAVSGITGRRYRGGLDSDTDMAFRVISDHVRAVSFAIADGVTVSNEGRGYVIRRLIRRASRFGRLLGMHEPFIYKLVPVVAESLGGAFGELSDRAGYISTVIESEETGFGRTLDRGIEIFEDAAARAGGATISGEDAFQLYDTYGFPLDLTQLMAAERGLRVDSAGFEELMDRQRQRAREAHKSAPAAIPSGAELPFTDDSAKYGAEACTAKVAGLIEDSGVRFRGAADPARLRGIILDKTCFYAEAGGQIGDTGTIRSKGGRFVVERTEKHGECVCHRGRLAEGGFSVGDEVFAEVGPGRPGTRKNHTATHLLQWALRRTLGRSVAQQGSYVCGDYLRFDFTHPKALTAGQVAEVERLVREKISSDAPVRVAVMPRAKAEKLGAMALFGEKYASEVRVVAIGAAGDEDLGDAFSREFCGGTHVDRLGDIGGFKIVSQQSIAAGVRRITAVTGPGLAEYLENRSRIVDELSVLLKSPAEKIRERVEQLIDQNRKLARELKSASKKTGEGRTSEVSRLLAGSTKKGGSAIVTGRLETDSADEARAAVDALKKKAKSAAIVLGFVDGGKAVIVAGVTDDLIKKGLKAGDIVKAASPVIGGGGGGQPHLAQAGGKSPEKIEDALAAAAKLIGQKLGG
jgi:alanyl-tRNA synthetase